MLIKNNLDSPNILRDNVQYYISGFIVQSLLTNIQCVNCSSESLLDADDPHSLQQSSYLMVARLTSCKQRGRLMFPSNAVLNNSKGYWNYILKKHCWPKHWDKYWKKFDLKIECAVFEQLGPSNFNNVPGHFFEHRLGI